MLSRWGGLSHMDFLYHFVMAGPVPAIYRRRDPRKTPVRMGPRHAYAVGDDDQKGLGEQNFGHMR